MKQIKRRYAGFGGLGFDAKIIANSANLSQSCGQGEGALMRHVTIAGLCCTALLFTGCQQKTGINSEARELERAKGVACLARKDSAPQFELRNWRTESVQNGNGLSVVGCLATHSPETMRKASVSFVVFDADGKIIGKDGYQLLTPAKTSGSWSSVTAEWTVPVGVIIQADAASAKNIEITIKWMDPKNWREEKYWVGATPARQAENAWEADKLSDDASSAGCSWQNENSRFSVSNARLRLASGPKLMFTADMRNTGQPSITTAGLVVSGFDKGGNMIGVNGAQLGAPPPSSSPIAVNVTSTEPNTARISNMLLLTFRWHDKNGCRWSENHFVNASRQ